MKIQIISDIHLEFFSSIYEIKYFCERLQTNAETIILAGDIGVLNKPKKLLYFLNYLSDNYKNIIYVLGNHEYYNYCFDNVENDLNELIKDYKNIYLLENDLCILDNIIFCGTTLWFEENNITNEYKNWLNDYRLIYNFNPNLKNKLAIDYIKEIEESNLPQILITHHLPSKKSINIKYTNELTNCFYVCDIEKYLNKFDICIHGHTHSSNDYYLNNTKIISNPYGYNYENKEFDFNKIVEIN